MKEIKIKSVNGRVYKLTAESLQEGWEGWVGHVYRVRADVLREARFHSSLPRSTKFRLDFKNFWFDWKPSAGLSYIEINTFRPSVSIGCARFRPRDYNRIVRKLGAPQLLIDTRTLKPRTK